ncbi:MAG: PQQ-binding-like beta-propeller repeat protein [Thermoguttaceae bacterium]
MSRIAYPLLSSLILLFAAAADWPQWGGSPARNNTPDGKNIPVEWDVGKFDEKSGRWLGDSAKNIRWVARLGSTSYGTPVVADGRVFCASNNGGGWLKQYPAKVDLGCLLCFRQSDGRFEWQLSCQKLARVIDYPDQGICCSPLVEGKRLWVVTNRCEVVCLKTEGSKAKPNEPDVVWRFDMVKELGVTPYSMSSCSVTAVGALLLVNTSNGADHPHKRVPSPNAPSFIALDKLSGKLIWADNSPGNNILDGQWSSPAAAVLGGVPQAIFPGGDGWVYSFRAAAGVGGKPELLWKFDTNPKKAVWKPDGSGKRNNLVATPVVHDGRVYIAVGAEPDYGAGPGCLWCIDPTRRGDVSPELVIDKQGKPISDALRAARRICAIDESAGETLRPNPNSAVVWRYTGVDANGNGKLDFEETMHRSISMAVIRDGLLVIPDLQGVVHCLDAKTGKVHWTQDLMAEIWGSPCVVDGKIYLGDRDGDVVVFELSPKPNQLAKNAMGDQVNSTPVVADNMLYIATTTHLIAVGRPQTPP